MIHRLEKAKRLQEELFRELQHRVANNLQLAVVMLRNARRRVEDVLAESFRDLSVDVDVGVDVEAGDALSLDQITALVLLVNEAAINAAKHVFSKGLGRRFAVSLSRDESGRLSLMIADDGPGIDAATPASPAPSPAPATPTLGMNIMRAFATQLGGTLQVAGAPGCKLRVEFAGAWPGEGLPRSDALFSLISPQARSSSRLSRSRGASRRKLERQS